jgi:hypothetical protein
MNPESIRDKYRERERESVITNILLKMEEFGITFQELEVVSETTEIHLRDQILALRKKANIRRQIDGRRKEAETNRQAQQSIRGKTSDTSAKANVG